MFPYIGGKASHVKWMDNLFPNPLFNNYNTFVEVFGGAGWVGIKSNNVLQAREHIYNDFNPFIANIHRAFTKHSEELLDTMKGNPKSDEDLYYKFRDEIFKEESLWEKLKEKLNQGYDVCDIDLAAKYLYIQTQIFSGTTINAKSKPYFCDQPSKKSGKVWGSKYEAVMNKLENPKIIDRLKRITKVENLDCIELIKKYDFEDTFFYADPPYHNMEFYYTQDFPREKHKELADTLKACKGKFALSYYDFPDLREWFPEPEYKWHEQEVNRPAAQMKPKTQKEIDSGKKTIMGTGIEILVRNYEL